MTTPADGPPAYATDLAPYLDRIERLQADIARLRAMLGYMLATCRSIRGQVANNDISTEWCDEVIDPFIDDLNDELKK